MVIALSRFYKLIPILTAQVLEFRGDHISVRVPLTVCACACASTVFCRQAAAAYFGYGTFTTVQQFAK